MIRAGASPKLIASTSESNSSPNLVPVFVTRATLPSSISASPARTINQAATSKWPRVAETIAQIPKKRFPSVRALGTMITPRCRRLAIGSAPVPVGLPLIEGHTDEPLEELEVPFRGREHDLLWQFRPRLRLGPEAALGESLKMIADRLLVEGGLRTTGRIPLEWPEP